MTDESVLKKATMYSVLLMLLVVIFSFFHQDRKDNVSYANDKNTITSEQYVKPSITENIEDVDGSNDVLNASEEDYNNIVVIDAGHGGIDSGTYSSGFEHLEKDINLSILLYLKELLDKTNIKVYYTRTTDEKIPLSQRVGLANEVNADLFLSIHCNASDSADTKGIEVLYNEKQNDLTSFRSIDFASICLEEINKIINRNNRGVVPRSKNVQIIGDSNVPVALVEVGFMTSIDDLNFLLNESNQELVAKGIYQAILRALEEIGTSAIN